MENPHTIDPERGQRDAICARCGGDAEWIFADGGRTRVQVTCPNCGKFEMTRVEFDRAESEILEPDQQW